MEVKDITSSTTTEFKNISVGTLFRLETEPTIYMKVERLVEEDDNDDSLDVNAVALTTGYLISVRKETKCIRYKVCNPDGSKALLVKEVHGR